MTIIITDNGQFTMWERTPRLIIIGGKMTDDGQFYNCGMCT